MDYLESLSSNAFTFITSITSLLIGLFVSPLLDLIKTKFATREAATEESNRLKKLLSNQLDELLEIFKANSVVHDISSKQNKMINNFTDAYNRYKDLGGTLYQLNINSEFNEKGIYERILKTIDSIEQTTYHGWIESSDKLRYLKQLNHAIECAVKTPRSYYAEDVLKIASAFQNADAPSKNFLQRTFLWLRRK